MRITLLVSILLLTIAACKEGKDSESQVVSIDTILNKYYDAVGGYDAIKKIETLEMHGHYIEPAYNLIWPATFLKKRPHFRRIGLGPEQPDQIQEGFDGAPWEYHKGDKVIRSTGESAKAIRVANDFDAPFVDASQKGHRMEALNDTVISGKSYHRLQLTMEVDEEDYSVVYFFNTRTGLWELERKKMPIHATGPDIGILKSYSEFRTVSGVLFPYVSIERRISDGTFLNAAVWDRIEANLPVDDKDFRPPAEE